MKFNRTNVIDSTSSDSDDIQLNILDVIKGKNNAEMEANTKRIWDYLDLYENKELNTIDEKIFKGIIEKNLSENDAFSDSEDIDSKKSSLAHNDIQNNEVLQQDEDQSSYHPVTEDALETNNINSNLKFKNAYISMQNKQSRLKTAKNDRMYKSKSA